MLTVSGYNTLADFTNSRAVISAKTGGKLMKKTLMILVVGALVGTMLVGCSQGTEGNGNAADGATPTTKSSKPADATTPADNNAPATNAPADTNAPATNAPATNAPAEDANKAGK
jgi:hypothetical protein